MTRSARRALSGLSIRNKYTSSWNWQQLAAELSNRGRRVRTALPNQDAGQGQYSTAFGLIVYSL